MPISTARRSYLFALATSSADAEAILAAVQAKRGIHAASIDTQVVTTMGPRTDEDPLGYHGCTSKATGWRTLEFRGTDKACRAVWLELAMGQWASNMEHDRNADHDHAACIASAARQGVPAAWAHTPETYRSM